MSSRDTNGSISDSVARIVFQVLSLPQPLLTHLIRPIHEAQYQAVLQKLFRDTKDRRTLFATLRSERDLRQTLTDP
jgi:DnaJ-domain-containing protein 1